MAIIKPFRALRPKEEYAKQAACVPYDVVYTSEVREYIDQNPLSFLRVTRAEAEFDDESTVEPEEIFARAKKNLEKFLEDEIFFQDVDPSIYIYQLSTGGHSQTGVVACCLIDEYESGLIKKHEKTRPDKVQDRTQHMLALKAQTGLIFLAFRNTDTLREMIHDAVKEEPLYRFDCDDGVRQTVWKTAEPDQWIDAFQEVPALYIADGHHRAESSSLARSSLRQNDPGQTGREDYNYVIAGMYPAEDLKILAYNRVVKDLNGLSEVEFLSRIESRFAIEDATRKEPDCHGEFLMYMSGKWRKLTIADELIDRTDPIERLDVSMLHKNLLAPILAIGDARTDNRIGFVGGARGTDELERIVEDGTARVAFSLFPTTMDDLFAVSDIGEIMPPKSTWFEPKLKDGLLAHLI